MVSRGRWECINAWRVCKVLNIMIRKFCHMNIMIRKFNKLLSHEWHWKLVSWVSMNKNLSLMQQASDHISVTYVQRHSSISITWLNISVCTVERNPSSVPSVLSASHTLGHTANTWITAIHTASLTENSYASQPLAFEDQALSPHLVSGSMSSL